MPNEPYVTPKESLTDPKGYLWISGYLKCIGETDNNWSGKKWTHYNKLYLK